MVTLSDSIGEYLRKLISLSSKNYVDIRRADLAGKFNCVPSQINYVLATRFTTEKGYLVESRRGGRGFVRIYKINLNSGASIIQFFEEMVASEISEKRALDIIQRLYEERLITLRETALIEAVIKQDNLPLPFPLRDEIRAIMLKKIFNALLKSS